MQTIKDNLNEMDCAIIQHMLQGRASKNEGETVKYSPKGGGQQNGSLVNKNRKHKGSSRCSSKVGKNKKEKYAG